MATPTTTRRATVDDVDVFLADLQAGFDSYVTFAPLGWRPPDVTGDRDRTADRLADNATWGLIALTKERAVGHVAFFPAREHSGDRSGGRDPDTWKEQPVIPSLAHLWQLFVLPEWWGLGVAAHLHDAAIGEMRAQGYASARLFTPSLHARARRFYERRRWTTVNEGWNSELALMITGYSLTLG
jgi:GNAT superfamily N-acetyltransferase